MANVYYQHATLDGQIVRDAADKIKHSYNDVTYFMMGQLNINRENSLRLFVSSYTDNPSITDLPERGRRVGRAETSPRVTPT
ncbi:MAG: hypothetical protein ACLUQ6_03635 [Alistipes onderdonkii]